MDRPMGCFQIAGSQPERTCTRQGHDWHPGRQSLLLVSLSCVFWCVVGLPLPADLPLRPALPCAARTNIRLSLWPGADAGAREVGELPMRANLKGHRLCH